MIFPWNAGWHHLKTCTSSSADMRFQHLQQPDRSPITSARGATSEVVWDFRGNHGWTRGKSHFRGKSMKIRENPWKSMKIHENPIPSTGKGIKNSWWNPPFSESPEDSRLVRREFRVFHWAPVAHCWPVASEAGNHGKPCLWTPKNKWKCQTCAMKRIFRLGMVMLWNSCDVSGCRLHTATLWLLSALVSLISFAMDCLEWTGFDHVDCLRSTWRFSIVWTPGTLGLHTAGNIKEEMPARKCVFFCFLSQSTFLQHSCILEMSGIPGFGHVLAI